MLSSPSRLVGGPFFLRVSGTERFCFFHAPRGSMRGSVLAVHAFAEELNKSRAAVADGARALADAGFAVLAIDLAGCGDSAGDFADASWDAWLADLAAGWQWLDEHTSGERWLWGTRFGALLANRFAEHASPPVDGLLLWQPVANGTQHLTQFLRLKTVGGLLRDASSAAAPDVETSPRAALAAGEVVEVAGYRLAPALADAMDAASLGPASATPPRVHWFEVVTREGANPSAVAARAVEAWSAAGRVATVTVVTGSPFWQTAEIERCPALVSATVEAMVAR